MGRGLAALGLAPGEEVTEVQLRNLFGERGRHPYADRIEADRLAKRESAKKAFRADAPDAGSRSQVWISCSGRSRRSTSYGRWGMRRRGG